MYAGRAVESGPARAVLSTPAHPYTRCLQLANPSLRAERRALYVMPEQMPSFRRLSHLSGCHCAPRCPLAAEECRRDEPPSIAVAADRHVACIRAAATRTIATPARDSVAADAPGQSLLQVEALQKHYLAGGGLFAGARLVAAVKQATFSIAENEFVALVGESGSGKSTIARLLVGLEQPTAGKILLDGEDLTDPSTRSRARRAASLQMVFQDPQSALNPRRRVASIVTQAMEAGSRHASWDERLTRTRELLAEVGLSADFAARLPGQLSAASASASTSRARCAACRKSWSPTKSCPVSMSRSRPSCSTRWRGCAPSSASPCCSSPTICPSCVVCAAACW